MAKSTTQRLKDKGFDKSYYDRSSGTWEVQCSQCVAIVINGLACHETGCPGGVLKPHLKELYGDCPQR